MVWEAQPPNTPSKRVHPSLPALPHQVLEAKRPRRARARGAREVARLQLLPL
jgi:hypothetical protein